jgi:hypothetical protein
MIKQRIFLLLFASLMAASGASAQKLDWQAIEKLKAGDRIWVNAQQQHYCYFEKATDDKLFCNPVSAAPSSQSADLVFNRKDIRDVCLAPLGDYDYSKGYLSLILGAGGGGGWGFIGQPNAFAGVKIGGPATLDLQYDCIQGHSGFSTEGSAVIPLFRVPSYQPFKEKKFVKVYAEPGVGYRAGGGPFGGYSSAKVLAVLLTDTGSDDWVAPYVEYQRRFPFASPLQGDNRISIGVMLALCEHCGLN